MTIDEGGLVPYPASYVCTNKYGDCKALTNYMKAMLKHAGITSYYTLINAGDNASKINTSFPSQQFNHVILCVPLGQDTIWLENTSKYLPYNYLGTFTQNRYGLMVNGADSKLVKTPALKAENTLEKCSYLFSLDIQGNGKLEMHTCLLGSEFESYKYLKETLNEKDQQERIRHAITIKNVENIEFEIDHPERDQPRLYFHGSVDVSNQFKSLGKSMAILPFAIYDQPDKIKNHQHETVRINYPVHKSDSIVYDLPFIDLYQVKLPPDVDIEGKFGSYRHHYHQHQNQIIAEREFLLYANEYPANERKEFVDFLELAATAQQKSVIILNPK